MFLGPFLTTVAELAAGCELGADSCDGSVYPLGIKIAAGSLLPVPDLAVGVPHRVRAAGHRGDRRPVGAQEAAARRLPRSPAPAPPSRWPSSPATATCSAGRCSWSPTSPSAPRSWSTTRSCRSSAAPTNATASPVAAGRWATSAAACCWPLNLVAITLLDEGDNLGNAPWTWPAGRSCPPACGGRCSPLVPLRWLRNRAPASRPWPAAGNVLTDGFRQLGRTLRDVKAYPLTLYFLLAFLVYNDGIQTVITLASQYGTEELGLEPEHPGHHDPAGAVPRLRRRVEPGRAGQAHRRLEDSAAQPGALDRCDHRRVPASRRGAAAVHGPRRGHRPGPRRQPGADPVAVQPAHPGRARKASTSASTRSATRAPAGSARSPSAWPSSSPRSYRVASSHC